MLRQIQCVQKLGPKESYRNSDEVKEVSGMILYRVGVGINTAACNNLTF